MDRLVFFTDEQKQAILKDKSNIIVSAGAGSGKTQVLTERIINKLLNGINITDIIVLTFTNLSANEMKERIRKKITLEVKNGNDIFLKQLDLIDNAYITTFDSYALSLVKKYHYLLNIDKNVNIGDNSIMNVKKIEIIETIFNNLYIKQDEDFLKLLDDYTIYDDDIIKDFILKLSCSIDLTINKEEYLKNYIDDYFNDKKIEKDIALYLNNIYSIVDKINLTLEKCISILNDDLLIDYFNKLKENLNALLNYTCYEDIKNNINIKFEAIPRKKDIDSIEKEALKSAVKLVKNELKKLSTLCTYENKTEIKDNINNIKNNVAIIIKILKLFYKYLDEYKKQNNIYEFNDISKLAIKLLELNEDILKDIKNNTHEILVDEYQDTSDIQEYFLSLIENNNLYMVGDMKQSIYRFRNANPNIFSNKYDKYKKNIGGISIDLMKNFRSRKEVLDFINLIFMNVMDKDIGGVDYVDNHSLIFGNNNYTKNTDLTQNNDAEILIYNRENEYKENYKSTEIEAFIVANDIKNKIENGFKILDKDTNQLRNVLYKDILILVDRKSNFKTYNDIFSSLNVPLFVVKSEKIVYSNEILCINNILKMLLCINDKNYSNKHIKHAFYSVCRSFLLEYSDKDIIEAINSDDILEYIKLSSKFKPFYDKLININKIYNNSVYDILLEIYKEFDIYVNVIKIKEVNQSIKKLDYLLDFFKNLSDLNYNLYDSVMHFDKLYKMELDVELNNDNTSDNACTIMSIHASKGLEASVCYYTELDNKFNLNESKEKFFYSTKHGIILPSPNNDFLRNTIYKTLYNNELKLDEISEKVRLFYVALTRAKEKIIIVTKDFTEEKYTDSDELQNLKTEYGSFYDVLDSINMRLKPYIKSVDLNTININNNYMVSKKEPFNIELTDEIKVIEYYKNNISKESIKESKYSKTIFEVLDDKDRKNIEKGNEIHKILEYIDFNNLDNKNINELGSDIASFINKLKNTFDFKNTIKIYKEHEFIYDKDNTTNRGIIDLMLEYDNKIIIIDYKLSDIDKSYYKDQIDGYKKYIESMTNKETLTYLYSILKGEYIKLS